MIMITFGRMLVLSSGYMDFAQIQRLGLNVILIRMEETVLNVHIHVPLAELLDRRTTCSSAELVFTFY